MLTASISMNIFQRLAFAFKAKSINDVIMPGWDSVDLITRTSSRTRTPGELLNYNKLTLYVNKAINKRAEKVSQIEFTLSKGEKQIEEHDILTLLNRPNPHHTGRQFWKLYQKYLDITGRAFIYIARTKTGIFSPETVELHLLRPDLVSIERDTAGLVTGYRYRMGNRDSHRTFDPDEIIYSFNPDPLNPLEGESILMSGIRAMDTENDLADYHASVLKNGGRVDGVFSFKSSLTATQLQELQEQYVAKYAEAKRAGRPMFLSGDATYERLALNPDELSYLETKKLTLNDICLMTGVPRAILAQTSDETFSNAEAAHNIFLRETIKPLLEDLTTVLDWRFVPDELDLGFIDPTPDDIERTVKVVTAMNAVNAATTNEKREQLGLEPLPQSEADEVFVPFSLSPLTGSTDEPTPTTVTEEDKKKGYDHPLRDPFVRRRYEKLMVRRYDRREKLLKKAIIDYFKKQEARLIDHLEGVRTYRRKDLFGEAFDMSLEITIAKTSILPLLRQFLEESGQNAMELLGSSSTFVLASEIGSWLDERAETFAKQINDTTFEKLKRQFEESLAEGENRKQLIERIQNTYDGYTEGRATTIARTEVHNATQRGTFAGYQQAGVPIKIWVTVGDLNVRDAHQIDGQERPINMPFDLNDGSKLMYPGDLSGDPSVTVNCRCSI